MHVFPTFGKDNLVFYKIYLLFCNKILVKHEKVNNSRIFNFCRGCYVGTNGNAIE